MTRTAAQDSALRLAMGMMAADRCAPLEARERARLIDRLQDQAALSDAERAALREPLLAYLTAYHPRIREIVAKQFEESGAEEGPQGETTPTRPSAHYGLVPERR